MRIGELASAAACDVETVRYYERIGLLAEPARTEAGYRSYGQPQVERLRFIRHCRALHIGLADIGTLLQLRDQPAADCAEVDALLDNQIERVQQQMVALAELQAELTELRRRCCRPTAVRECAILRQLGENELTG